MRTISINNTVNELVTYKIPDSKSKPSDVFAAFKRAAIDAYNTVLNVLTPAPQTYDLKTIAQTILPNQQRPDVPKAIQAQNRQSNFDTTTAFISLAPDGFIKVERAFQPEYRGKGSPPGVYIQTDFYTPEGKHRGAGTPVAYIKSLKDWETEQLQDSTKTVIPIESDPIAQKHHYARSAGAEYPISTFMQDAKSAPTLRG